MAFDELSRKVGRRAAEARQWPSPIARSERAEAGQVNSNRNAEVIGAAI
jgi:hypothetical protein